MRVALLAVAAGLIVAACTTGPSQSIRRQTSTASPLTHPVPAKLHQQAGLRFVHPNGANPDAVTVLASSRTLQPGRQGVVLTVRGLGNLMGSCSPGRPAVRFRLTGRGLAGPPVVTEVLEPLAKPVGLRLLLAPYVPQALSPAGGGQRLAFFQIVGGGESADFSLAVWATLTPVAGGCAFSANGVLRVRGSGFLHRLG